MFQQYAPSNRINITFSIRIPVVSLFSNLRLSNLRLIIYGTSSNFFFVCPRRIWIWRVMRSLRKLTNPSPEQTTTFWSMITRALVNLSPWVSTTVTSGSAADGYRQKINKQTKKKNPEYLSMMLLIITTLTWNPDLCIIEAENAAPAASIMHKSGFHVSVVIAI